MSFPNFYGNAATADALSELAHRDGIPQTILLHGPEGIGKATLVRRFAAALLGDPAQIEQDDLSLPHNQEIVAGREKWTAEKRNEDPLLFASHPDFTTFAPDGPLRQISIPQMRLLRERAQFQPLRGSHRVFLIDHIDRANEQAANSLLKTLEEPPPYLILIITAENPYDLLPTIRSRSISFSLTTLSDEEMRAFAAVHKLPDAEKRIALSSGCPGAALSLDLESYEQRRSAMLKVLQVASGGAQITDWAKLADSLGVKRNEKLDLYLKVLYLLLEDLLLLSYDSGPIRNRDIRPELEKMTACLSFEWLRRAVVRVDELMYLVRRNIQKTLAFDGLIAALRET